MRQPAQYLWKVTGKVKTKLVYFFFSTIERVVEFDYFYCVVGTGYLKFLGICIYKSALEEIMKYRGRKLNIKSTVYAFFACHTHKITIIINSGLLFCVCDKR